MKMAKKLLAVAMVLSMVAAFTAIAFAAGPSVSFSVGDYADGKATVAVSLVDCVDLTSGSLNFSYETEKVSKILKKNGTDAKAIGDIDNAFNSEFNADTNPAEFGFYFKNKLWDNDAWKEAADELGQDDVVNGENFECIQLVFTAEDGAVITVTGELKFGDTAVAVNKTFKIGNGSDPYTTEKEPEESICKPYLVKIEAKAATCTEDGNIAYYKCSVCGKTFNDADAKNEITNVTIKAKGHDWTEWIITKEDSSTDGRVSRTYYRTCKVCGTKETKGHICNDDGSGNTVIGFDPLNGRAIIAYDEFGTPIYSKWIGGTGSRYLVFVEGKDATCTDDGYITHCRCIVCGKVYSIWDVTKAITDVTIPAKGHTWGDWGYSTTAVSTDGKSSMVYCRTCKVCGVVEYKTEKDDGAFYIGGDDGLGKTILAFDPLNGKAIVGYDKFGNAIYSENPLARRSVVLDDSGAVNSTTPAGSSNNGTSSSAASSAAGTKTSSSTSTVSASVKTDGGKKTGDNGVLAVLAGVVALAGAAFVVTRKRK